MSLPAQLPPLVQRATALARAHRFGYSCIPQVGQLLRVLAASGTGTAAESGTGYGVGTAWIRSGLRPDSRVGSSSSTTSRSARPGHRPSRTGGTGFASTG